MPEPPPVEDEAEEPPIEEPSEEAPTDPAAAAEGA
jgi:hypothetical protein